MKKLFPSKSVWIILGAFVFGCGLEDITFLTISDSKYATQSEADTVIDFEINKGLNQYNIGQNNFKGFEILYKIMPDKSGPGNLTDDLGKTWEVLKTIYFRPNLGDPNVIDSDTRKAGEPLIPINLTDPIYSTPSDLALEIDFSNFLSLNPDSTAPYLNIWPVNGGIIDKSGSPIAHYSLFRYFDDSIFKSRRFKDLLDSGVDKSNMADLANLKNSPPTTVEIDFFIVAIGYDFKDGYSRSEPKPLGIISQIPYNY